MYVFQLLMCFGELPEVVNSQQFQVTVEFEFLVSISVLTQLNFPLHFTAPPYSNFIHFKCLSFRLKYYDFTETLEYPVRTKLSAKVTLLNFSTSRKPRPSLISYKFSHKLFQKRTNFWAKKLNYINMHFMLALFSSVPSKSTLIYFEGKISPSPKLIYKN